MIEFVNQFEQAFYHSPIGMAVLSIDGKWLKVNQALAKMIGYSEEELLSITFHEITHPDDIEADVYHIEKLLNGKKESYEMEKRYIHKNGQIIWVFLSVSTVQKEGEPILLISQVQNITERKQLELNLVESEERFRNLITNLPDPILVHDGEQILFANNSAAKYSLTTADEMVGLPILEFIELDSGAKVQSFTRGIIKNNKPLTNFDISVQLKNGQVQDAILSAIPITYMGKKAVLVSYRDITERKKMEQALKESEERYRLLIEHSPLGIVVHQNREIQYANSTAIQLLGGKDETDLVGKNIFNFIHPDFRDVVSKEIASLEQGALIPTTNEKYIRLDGKEIDVEVNGTPIQLDGESAVQVVFWDVTEKKKESDLVRYRAYHDTLTDLPNRLKFHLDLNELLEKNRKLTLMYLDLHGLKPVNDTYGHQAGDTVLVKVTARLSGALDSLGSIYRIGGDEFAIVLRSLKNKDEIQEISNKIAEVMKHPIYISNTIVYVSASIGVVFSPEHGPDIEALLRNADMAMYHAKKNKILYKIFEN